MRYTELIESNVRESEIIDFIVGGETVAVTIRIPANLRDSAKEAAAHRGMSFSAFVRMCMIQELSKRS